MPQVLTYASGTYRRFCKVALAALAIGLLGPLVFYAVIWAWPEYSHQEAKFWLVLLMLFSFPTAGVTTGVIAVHRIHDARGQLRGTLLSMIGIFASILWPIVVVGFLIASILRL